MKFNIYYLRGKKVEPLPLNTLEPFIYKDIQDTRNYAMIYVYPDSLAEAVVRTSNLYEHHLAIPSLVKQSSVLSKIPGLIHRFDILHFQFDTILVKNGILTIYYSTSSLQEKDAFGLMNVPEELTDFQRDFIKNHFNYFSIYEDILINQYDSFDEQLCELNQLWQGNSMGILNKLANHEKVDKLHPNTRI